MAAIKSKNTKPELFVRSLLYSNGFRYRIHEKKLPGTPDIVFHKRKAVIFVHGCFWHGHECENFRVPKTRRGYWMEKIGKNIQRDHTNIKKILNQDWRVGVVWECSMRGKNRLETELLLSTLCGWLNGGEKQLEISSLNKVNLLN